MHLIGLSLFTIGHKDVTGLFQRGKHKPFLRVLAFSAFSTIPLASTSIHSFILLRLFQASSNKRLLNSITSAVLVCTAFCFRTVADPRAMRERVPAGQRVVLLLLLLPPVLVASSLFEKGKSCCSLSDM